MKSVVGSEMYFKAEHLCLDESQRSIAQGALTNSKRHSSYVEVFPTHLVSGSQEYVFDFEGKRYVDYICGLGCNLFGYTNPTIVDHLIRTLHSGVSLSLGSPSEVEFSRRFKLKFPFVDKIKILKTGSEGCSAAVRIARAYTGRSVIMSEGYHGWHDEFTSTTPPAKGVPHESNYQIDFVNLDAINEHVAAVIVEPVITDYSASRRDYLNRLRDACTRHGVMLIFDETITGLRFMNYSVANYWSIEPDLIVMGKALGNGLPISVVGGNANVMDCDYFVSSTYAGDRLALEAGICCLKLVTKDYNPEYLWNCGLQFIERMNEAVNPHIELIGYPSRGRFLGDRYIMSVFIQEMCKLGFLFNPQTWFYNIHLHNHLDNVVDCAASVIHRILSGAVSLQGVPYSLPFTKRDH